MLMNGPASERSQSLQRTNSGKMRKELNGIRVACYAYKKALHADSKYRQAASEFLERQRHEPHGLSLPSGGLSGTKFCRSGIGRPRRASVTERQRSFS